MKSYDTIIIGGGPSGMAAAIACLKGGQQVLLVDRLDKLGKKILVTGNGRCNLTNLVQRPDCYRSEQGERAWNILSQFPLKDTCDLFAELGILIKDKEGYVYPYNEQASSVREAFEACLMAHPKLTLLLESRVSAVEMTKRGLYQVSISQDHGSELTQMKRTNSSFDSLPGKIQDKRWNLQQNKVAENRNKKSRNASPERYIARNLIIATGGLVGDKLGCDGMGYGFARDFGHGLVTPCPALTSLKSKAPFLKKISGVRNRARIRLYIDDAYCTEETGELQWTDYGISGVAVFQLSRFAIRALMKGQQVKVLLDLLPDYDREALKALLFQYAASCPYKDYESLLKGFLPAKLAPVIVREARLSGSFDGDMSSIEKLVMAMKEFSLRISDFMGYEKAQVTSGGLSLEELSDSLESIYAPGLYFVGEVVDVDGTCGGYNLQWAFSSGTIAGRAACRERRQG